MTDRIRVWNDEIKVMMEPATIRELLCHERNTCIIGNVDQSDYGHLVFMRNTGIYAKPSKTLVHSTMVELFAEDLVTHSIEPYVYRVMYELGRWYAQSLRPDVVQTRALNRVFDPTIVGNTFENKDLMKRGQIDDDN